MNQLIVLLDIWTAPKEDYPGRPPNIFWHKLLLPGELITPPNTYLDVITYAGRLNQHMSCLQPTQLAQHDNRGFHIQWIAS